MLDEKSMDCEFMKTPFFCGEINFPGLATNFDLYVDFTNRETTVDQGRIEDALFDIFSPESNILHVGIGNSKLAERFCKLTGNVYGITISEGEKKHADSLDMDNYTVFLCNKYHRRFISQFVDLEFDFIVDNNLASFTCCRYHFYQMLENYISCLKLGGRILTDQRGMDWALAHEGFIMDYEQLGVVVKDLPLKMSQVSDKVYSLELTEGRLSRNQVPLVVYAKRLAKNGRSYVESFCP